MVSELFKAVEKALLKHDDNDESAALWRQIWQKYDRDGVLGVERYLEELCIRQKEPE